MAYMFYRQYDEATTIDFALWSPDGSTLKEDAVYEEGDLKISINEGAEGNTSNGFVDEGKTYSLALTASELQGARIVISINDQTSPQAFLDDIIIIETFGHANAMYEAYPANMTMVNGGLTNDYNATLSLKKLDIENDSGDAISAVSSGGDGNGMVLTGNGSGQGIKTDEIDAILAKLPSGTISDLDLTTVIDGITLEHILELSMAMVDGRVRKDYPETGDLTFYKRDNTTILTVTSSTDSERTRT